MGDERIAAVEEVPADGTLLYTLAEDGDEREAILVKLSDGAVTSFLNYCMHWTDVKLDTGDGAPVRNGDVVCRKHAATFEKESGRCTYGPCEGAQLDPVAVETRDGAVFLVDDDYEFVRTGVDDGDPVDLSTSPGSRLGF
ncbi:Rieske 2Fe-2S domain-containing protein [Halobacterium sp. CBA1126]|uniref:Rieske (2Fe-2S) protein n=1 Tax=Halobacterium TaxID=2239 RepID=UPI0012FCD303|nr:Rieske 2Fe-2S domain-containing protein [Halobacterium sp. CBA1126]MUV61002.1 Rieske 2Fe-2S domain-containing protein [Halobacterium sp. CBA1126]